MLTVHFHFQRYICPSDFISCNARIVTPIFSCYTSVEEQQRSGTNHRPITNPNVLRMRVGVSRTIDASSRIRFGLKIFADRQFCPGSHNVPWGIWNKQNLIIDFKPEKRWHVWPSGTFYAVESQVKFVRRRLPVDIARLYKLEMNSSKVCFARCLWREEACENRRTAPEGLHRPTAGRDSESTRKNMDGPTLNKFPSERDPRCFTGGIPFMFC